MAARTAAPDYVLIVDDDPLLRVIAEQFFRSRGVRSIRSAEDGRVGLEILEADQPMPDLIICDLNMPKVDGMQFLRLLKERGYRGAIAILSGEHRSLISLAETLARTHQLNVVAALSKPLRPKELETVLGRLSRCVSVDPVAVGAQLVDGELQRAIAAGEIVPYYQPKIEVYTGRVAGVEALARWHHPGRGLIMPGSFVDVAERSGLIRPLTRSIIHQVVRDAQQMLKLRPQMKIAVNMSAEVLDDIKLPDQLAELLAAADLSPSSFILEITESRLIDDAVPIEVLARLRMQRFTLSIDDFGTAHSNLEHLSRFPFGEIKIDRMFAGKVLSDDKARAGVEAIILLASKLGLRIVAEGVEERDTAKFLAQSGVHELQGYLFARPLPLRELLSFLVDHAAVPLTRMAGGDEPPHRPHDHLI